MHLPQGRAGGIEKQLATSIPHDDAPPLVSYKNLFVFLARYKRSKSELILELYCPSHVIS
jgi:hypothetical protein